MSVEDPLCGEVQASCICILAPKHDGSHVCSCRGSWHFDENGEFCADVLPNEMGLFEAMGYMLGGWPS